MTFGIPAVTFPRGLLITLLLVSASGVWADTQVYRYVDENGVVSFSATPPPSPAVEAEKIDVIDTNTMTHEPLTAEQRKARERYQEVTTRLREREAAQHEKAQRIAAARRELEERRKALEQGRAPLPGERAGTANGSSRLLPAYYARIRALEQRVAEAERALEQLLQEK